MRASGRACIIDSQRRSPTLWAGRSAHLPLRITCRWPQSRADWYFMLQADILTSLSACLLLVGSHRLFTSGSFPLDCMSPPQMRRLTLDVATRVTRIGRAEPQTRRVSHGSSYRSLCRNRYVEIV